MLQQKLRTGFKIKMLIKTWSPFVITMFYRLKEAVESGHFWTTIREMFTSSVDMSQWDGGHVLYAYLSVVVYYVSLVLATRSSINFLKGDISRYISAKKVEINDKAIRKLYRIEMIRLHSYVANISKLHRNISKSLTETQLTNMVREVVANDHNSNWEYIIKSNAIKGVYSFIDLWRLIEFDFRRYVLND